MRQGLWLTFILLLLVTLIVISHAQSPRAETVPNAGAVGPPRAAGNLEVLSDTKGVDFNPYLSKLLQKVRANWYNVIPEEARPPQLAAGVTSIEFAILKTGDVRGMRLVHQSGLVNLDRAAWGGIAACVPFDPLPQQFTGEFLALRMHFYHKPKNLPPNQQPVPPPANLPAKKFQPH